MIALTRFQLSGYVRSQRILHPLIAVALLMFLALIQSPASDRPENTARLVMGNLGDVAAFLIPIGAWATRALLDTQPDVQRDLSFLALGSRSSAAVAGLLAGYLTNVALAALLLVLPLYFAITLGIGVPAILAGIGLSMLAAVPATLLGAWACRAVIPAQAWSILALLGGSVMLLVLSMGPLSPLSIPMIGWLRAAQHGPQAFTSAFPGVALHLAVWSALVGALYVLFRRSSS